MSARRQADWIDGTERLHVAEQHAGMPQHGLIVKVSQRTTGSGRAVLLSPEQVTELHTWLGEYLATMNGAQQ